MLAKLLKYDFKSMFKIFLPLWGVLLVVSVINRLFMGPGLSAQEEMGLVDTLMMLFYTLLTSAVMVVTTVIIILRFYRGLLKDEGYLMFTIPVHTWQLTASKLVSALVISLISTVVAVVSVFIIASYSGMWEDLGKVWALGRQLVSNFEFLVFLLVVSFFVGMVASIAQVYAAMALGHLASKHRVGFSVLAFIGLNMAWSMVSSVVGLLGYPRFATALFTINIGTSVSIPDLKIFSDLLVSVTAWGLVLSLVECVVYIAITNYILSRRLNLE